MYFFIPEESISLLPWKNHSQDPLCWHDSPPGSPLLEGFDLGEGFLSSSHHIDVSSSSQISITTGCFFTEVFCPFSSSTACSHSFVFISSGSASLSTARVFTICATFVLEPELSP
uniref:Pco088261 n=1 Tax=Arundo donax TaxID=35708 RepID=A0A0A9E8A2_ARUDO